jgi:uncharacterized membrane protein
MVNDLLRRLANAPEPQTAPNPVEMAGMHVLYVFSLFLLVVPALRPMGVKWVNPLALLPMFFVMLCLSWGYLVWLAMARKPAIGVWFAAHAAWLAVTYAGLVIVGVLALGLFLVVLLFAAAVREAAYLLYGVMAVLLAGGVWFLARILWGYVALCRRRQVGFVPYASPPGKFPN